MTPLPPRVPSLGHRRIQAIRDKFTPLDPSLRYYSWMYARHTYYNCSDDSYMGTFMKVQKEEERNARERPQRVDDSISAQPVLTTTDTVPIYSTINQCL